MSELVHNNDWEYDFHDNEKSCGSNSDHGNPTRISYDDTKYQISPHTSQIVETTGLEFHVPHIDPMMVTLNMPTHERPPHAMPIHGMSLITKHNSRKTPMSTEQTEKVAERNRRGARKSRKKKKEEFATLQDDVAALQDDVATLQAENEELKNKLEGEKIKNSRLRAYAIKTRMECVSAGM
jgi:hypothetical protein